MNRPRAWVAAAALAAASVVAPMAVPTGVPTAAAAPATTVAPVSTVASAPTTAVTPAPDQIRWGGASVFTATLPGEPVDLEVWSSTPAATVELLLRGVVVATSTSVQERADHWLAVLPVDLSAVPAGAATLTMRVTTPTGQVRSSAKGFTVVRTTPVPVQVAPDQIRWEGASIWKATLPGERLDLEVWSSTPAAKVEVLHRGVVVATDTTVEARADHWLATAAVDLSAVPAGAATLTMRVTTPTGEVRSSLKGFTVERATPLPVQVAPDQIRWDGASVWKATLPAERVDLEVWSSTPAAKVEVLLNGTVVGTDTAVRARPDYWLATASVDLTGRSGSTNLVMRVTSPTGDVRSSTKGFTVVPPPPAPTPPPVMQPDQIRWAGASIWRASVVGAPIDVEVWSSTPARSVELLLDGRVAATVTDLDARPDHWRGTAVLDLTGRSGETTVTMRITPVDGPVRREHKHFTVSPVISPLTPEILERRPGPHNTGVPAGTALTPSGSLTITTPGAVVEDLDITGCVVVAADDVTIRRSRITCTSTPRKRAVVMDGTRTGLVIEDVEIDGGGTTDIGVDVSNVVMRRLNIHHVNDGVRMGVNVTVEDSWIHTMTRFGNLHPDAIQGVSAQDVVIRYNHLDPYNRETGDLTNAAIMLGSETGPMVSRNVLIEGNYLNGGNYTVNISSGITAENIVVRDNRFGPNARYGPILTRTSVPVGPGNVMDVFGTAVRVVHTP